MYKYCAATYKYIFSGTGYSKGSGTACSGKYTSCTCASGYHWSGSACIPHSYSCPSGYSASSSGMITPTSTSKVCSCGATSGTCYTCKACAGSTSCSGGVTSSSSCTYGVSSSCTDCWGTVRYTCKSCATGGSSSCSGQTSVCGSGYTQKSSCKDCSGTTRYTCERNTCTNTCSQYVSDSTCFMSSTYGSCSEYPNKTGQGCTDLYCTNRWYCCW